MEKITMHEKHKKKYYRQHYNYLLNRYKSIERLLSQAYEENDTRNINYYEVRLTEVQDELMDARDELYKNK